MRRYGAALFVTLGALLLRLLLVPSFGDAAPYLSFSPAVLFVAWRWGLGPGLCALTLGFLAGDYFLTPPVYHFGPYSRTEATLVLDYVVGAGTGAVLLYLLHRQRERTAAIAVEKEGEANQRRQAEEKLQAANIQLARHASELEERVAERTEELQRIARDLEELLYSIAHNLHAPNRALGGFAQILESEHASELSAQARELLQRIGAAARHNSALIDGVLELGHWTHEKLKFKHVPLRLVVENVLRGMDVPENVRIELPKPWPKVVTDPDALTTVVRHLLSNALKFSAQRTKPWIRVWADEDGTAWTIHVEDNGIGIPAEQTTRIFRAMETLHSPREYPGLGVGLAVVKRIVERMHGRIVVQSAIDEGSHFQVTLPLVSPPGTTSHREQRATAAQLVHVG